jgi:predicted AlkP superfamily phosphohydrolase/phosphomutase
VLLVGWDAADWKVIHPLLDAGHMPNLARLVERGVMGNLSTLQPILSPMLWTSIATGKRPYKHGVHGFTEVAPETGQVRPISTLSRTTKAVWNILHQQGKTCHVVGWWPSHPVEPLRGAMVGNHFQMAPGTLDAPWPLAAGTVHPPEMAEALATLRIHPHELEGDMLRPFVPRAPEVDQESDRRLHTLAKTIAECASVHAAATHILASRRDWDFAGVYYDAIDHFCHGFMRYHPPRLDWVSERDFELYSRVVQAAYVFHDSMLGVLVALAGDDATVLLVSDHGFQSDHLRPRSLPNEPAGPAAHRHLRASPHDPVHRLLGRRARRRRPARSLGRGGLGGGRGRGPPARRPGLHRPRARKSLHGDRSDDPRATVEPRPGSRGRRPARRGGRDAGRALGSLAR